MANFCCCLSVLFSTKCQKCLEKYRSNSISYGLPYKVLIRSIMTIFYRYQLLCKKHQQRQVPLKLMLFRFKILSFLGVLKVRV